MPDLGPARDTRRSLAPLQSASRRTFRPAPSARRTRADRQRPCRGEWVKRNIRMG